VRHLLVFGLLVFAGAFAVFAPATIAPRVIEFPAGVAYSSLEGTLWNMKFRNTYFRALPIGDIDVALSPLPLIIGEAQSTFKIEGGSVRGSGAVSVGKLVALENFEFSTQAKVNFGSSRIYADMTVEGESIKWDRRGQCISAQAKLITNAPKKAFAAFQENLPDTVADIECIDGRMEVVFSQDVGVSRLSGKGVFTEFATLDLELVLRFPDQAAMPEIAAGFMRHFGFAQKQDGWYSEVTLRL